MHRFRIMSKRGDDQPTWDPADEGSVAVAEKIFDEHVTKLGGAAFATYATHAAVETPVREGPGATEDVRETRRITSFDPLAEEIVVVPRMQGGC